MSEDADATAAYEAAHHALYEAPTDLDIAARLVGRYQQALAPRAPRAEELR
jgi:hypothetical protein